MLFLQDSCWFPSMLTKHQHQIDHWARWKWTKPMANQKQYHHRDNLAREHRTNPTTFIKQCVVSSCLPSLLVIYMNNITQCTRKLDYVSGVSAFRVRLDSPVSRNIESSIHKLIYRYNILLTILFPWGCEHIEPIYFGVKLNIYFHTKRRT